MGLQEAFIPVLAGTVDSQPSVQLGKIRQRVVAVFFFSS